MGQNRSEKPRPDALRRQGAHLHEERLERIRRMPARGLRVHHQGGAPCQRPQDSEARREARHLHRGRLESLTLIVLAYVISVINMVRTLKGMSKENSEKLRITDVHEQKTAALEYVLTFVLPMFAFEFTQWESCILFAIYFLTLLILCSKHNLLFANMVFEVLNYRFYDVAVQNGHGKSVDREVISKQHLENMKEEDIYLRSMNNGFWFDVSDK